MESAIGKTIYFGLRKTKFVVVSEMPVNNGQKHSIVQLKGVRGGERMAVRSKDNTYKLS